MNANVVDLVEALGSWNWAILQDWLPANVLQKIIAIPPPDDNCGEDRRTWVEGNHGNFTVASVYSLLLNLNYGIEDIMWAKIWKLQTPERVKYFIWCAKHDRLLTRYRKSKMFLGPPYCMVCGDIVESALCVARLCSMHEFMAEYSG
jgi:hypothetical protein